jgi:hypothetical protein
MDSWEERNSGSKLHQSNIHFPPGLVIVRRRSIQGMPGWGDERPGIGVRIFLGGAQAYDWLEIPVDQEPYLRAIRLFNDGTFFEAHEVWEDVWRASVPPEKQFLQGLIQVAVALHHHGKGNLVGARSLLARGSRNLTGYPEGFGGIQLVRLLESLEQWRNALAEGKPVPRPPQL